MFDVLLKKILTEQIHYYEQSQSQFKLIHVMKVSHCCRIELMPFISTRKDVIKHEIMVIVI